MLQPAPLPVDSVNAGVCIRPASGGGGHESCVTDHPHPLWSTQLLAWVEILKLSTDSFETRISFERQLSAVPQCGEQHSRSTQRSSSVDHYSTYCTNSELGISPKIHSTVDLYSTISDLKSVEKSRPPFEHSGGHVTSHHTVSNR